MSDTLRLWWTGYTDLWAMVRRMGPVLMVLGIIYIIAAMCWFIASALVPTWIGRYVTRMLMFGGLAWVAAPFYVALHRFVAFGEVRWLPSLDVLNGQARVYAVYAVTSTALYFVPPIIREVLTALGFEAEGWLVFYGLVPVIWVLLVRSTTLLPMAALSPSTASWSRAFAHSRGRAWSFFGACIAVLVPAFALLIVLGGAAARHSMAPPFFFAWAIVALLAVQLGPLAIATRLYQQHGGSTTDIIRQTRARLPSGRR